MEEKKPKDKNFQSLSAPLLLLVIFVLIFGTFTYRDSVGHFLFEKFRLVKPALFLANDAELALKIGNYYLNGDGDNVYDLEKAREYFNLALALDPNVPGAWHQLARMDFLEGSLYNALEKINKQIEIHGENFMPSYYVRGLIYGYVKQFKKAEEDFLKLLEWDSKNWTAYNDLAWIYFQTGEYEKAKKIARRGLEANQDNPWLLNILGISLLNLSSKKEAAGILEKALEKAKNLTEEDWYKAYPGNDPTIARAGIEGIIRTIELNLNSIAEN